MFCAIGYNLQMIDLLCCVTMIIIVSSCLSYARPVSVCVCLNAPECLHVCVCLCVFMLVCMGLDSVVALLGHVCAGHLPATSLRNECM
jgi:hypothetical protein